LFDDLKRDVEEMLANRDPGHDFSHVTRVFKIAERIGRQEGADIEILLTAVLLHDIILYPKGSEKRSRSAEESAMLAQSMLAAHGWPIDKIEKVTYCIRTHSYSLNLKPDTLEAKILQDADRLDALGAIGIARTFSVGGSEMRKFYNEEDPFCRTGRKSNDMLWTMDHFKEKLLQLENTMHTETAKREAYKRTCFMKVFLAEIEKELQ
jgi:uncharacterized protein